MKVETCNFFNDIDSNSSNQKQKNGKNYILKFFSFTLFSLFTPPSFSGKLKVRRENSNSNRRSIKHTQKKKSLFCLHSLNTNISLLPFLSYPISDGVENFSFSPLFFLLYFYFFYFYSISFPILNSFSFLLL